jgi:hypothetical protein
MVCKGYVTRKAAKNKLFLANLLHSSSVIVREVEERLGAFQWLQNDKCSKTLGTPKTDGATGDVYTGQWTRDGKLQHGRGVMVYADGSKYSGYWERGEKVRHGRMIFADGNAYTGAWVRNEPHGKGKLVYYNGTTYEGDFERGVTSG